MKLMEGNGSFWKSIQSKIILRMMLLSLVPLGIIALLVYLSLFNSQELARDSVDETRTQMEQKVVAVSLKNQASSVALELTGSIGERIQDLKQIMSSPAVEQLMAGTGDTAATDAYLEQQLQIMSHFAEMTITDGEGMVLASTNPETAGGQNLATRAWWQTDRYLSLEPMPDEQIMRLIICIPIQDSADPADTMNPPGWLIGVSRLDSGAMIPAYAEQLEEGRMTVFWGNRLIADSGDPARPFEPEITLSDVENIAFSAIDGAEQSGFEGETLSAVSGFTVIDEARVVVAYFRPGADEIAEVVPEISMEIMGSQEAATIVVQQPKDVAFAPLASLENLEDNIEGNTRSTIKASIWVIVGVFLTVLLVGYWLSRTLTRPIMNLHQGVREIINGNLDHRVGRKGEDEISQLSQAFDVMTDSVKQSQTMLAEYNAKLEATVEERTKELKHEIEERKRAQEESHNSAHKLDTIFQSMGEGLFVVNLNGDIMDVNQVQIRMFRYPGKEDLIGKSALVLVALKDRERIRKILNKAIASETAPAVMEFTAITYDNTEIEVEISSAELKDSFGDVLGFVTITRDITERKEMERQVKEQTSMLIQSEKMSSVGTMVAGVAHELNNPLTGIIMYAQHCMKRIEEGDHIYSVLDDIVKEARRCSEIVQNMLTFSRMEGEQEEDYPKGSVPQLVEKVVGLLSYRIRAEQVTISRDFPDDFPDISMKTNSIQQVLLNLIGNAMDAMSDCQTREIRITGRIVHQYARIEVEDTGEGIPPEIMKDMFNPFFTTKPSGKGTGLGLPISRSICRQHGGDLICDSEVGVGTRFTIWLPLQVSRASKSDLE